LDGSNINSPLVASLPFNVTVPVTLPSAFDADTFGDPPPPQPAHAAATASNATANPHFA
jgi:hypothetical protein